LLDRHHEGIDDFIAPDLLIAEVTNVLWKRCLRGDISSERASAGLTYLLSLSIPLIPSTSLVRAAFQLALEHRIAVYDALFLALSIDNACDLVTADRRFYNAVNAAFSQVKLLRDLQFDGQ
jgi:predicted nucleic acid-binding protein